MGELRKLSILLVDDMPSAEPEVLRGLTRVVDVPVDVTLFCPTDKEQPLGGLTLPMSEQLDKYDLALIDLELFRPEEPHAIDLSDLLGGAEVLPFLRRNAPWIPAIGYSHLFDESSHHFFPIACGYGFDGHVNGRLFRAKWLTQELWTMIYARARLQARRRILGDDYEASEDVRIDLKHLPNLLSRFLNLEDALRAVFYFCRKIDVELIPGGWSGASALRVFSSGRDALAGREGTWFVKVSASASELHQEARAHLAMMRSGLSFARSAPLLWPDVVCAQGTAVLAYQFAKNTRRATECVAGEGLSSVLKRVGAILGRLHERAADEREALITILQGHFSRRERLQTFSKVFAETPLGRLVEHQINYAGEGPLAHSVPYRRGLIHGDLHLDNVMLGDVDLLIDFAHARSGPIALDAAYIVADILMRFPDAWTTIPRWSQLHSTPMAVLQTSAPPALDGDAALFNIFLAYRLASGLLFDIPKAAKDRIKGELRTFDPLAPN